MEAAISRQKPVGRAEMFVTRFDGYSETSGVFASNFEGFISTSQASRLGGDVRYTFAPNSWVWTTAAWGHRPDGGKSPSIAGTLIDAQFSYTAPGLSAAKDWAEVGGGVRLPILANRGALTASLTRIDYAAPRHDVCLATWRDTVVLVAQIRCLLLAPQR
jgi:Autotransporter beta-domain